jgi:CBS domain-containing protein
VASLLAFGSQHHLTSNTAQNGRDDIEHVVKALKQRNVLSAPVLDDEKNVLGVIDLTDLLTFLVDEIGPTSNANAAVAESNMRHRDAMSVMLFSPRDVFTPLQASDRASLAAALFATGIHRCPLVTADNKLTGLVTQVDLAMDLVPVLRDGAAQELGHATLLSLGLGLTAPVYCLKQQEVGDTLAQLNAWQIGALCVCDDYGKLVANFSVSNLVHLWSARSEIGADLSRSVYNYLETYAPNALQPVTCTRKATLVDALTTMIEKQVHRLWIVDDEHKPVGVFSFTDLFRLLRDHHGPMPRGGAHSAFGVIFRTPAGEVMSLNESGEHVILRDAASDDHSIWQIEHLHNSAVAIRSARNTYIAVDDDHRIVLVPQVTPQAHWHLVHLDTGFVAIRSASGSDFLEPSARDSRVHSSWFHATMSTRPTKKQLFKMTSALNSASPTPTKKH